MSSRQSEAVSATYVTLQDACQFSVNVIAAISTQPGRQLLSLVLMRWHLGSGWQLKRFLRAPRNHSRRSILSISPELPLYGSTRRT